MPPNQEFDASHRSRNTSSPPSPASTTFFTPNQSTLSSTAECDMVTNMVMDMREEVRQITERFRRSRAAARLSPRSDYLATPPNYRASATETMSSLRDRVSELERDNSVIRNDALETVSENSLLSDRVRELQDMVNERSGRIRDLQDTITALESELSAAQSREEHLQNQSYELQTFILDVMAAPEADDAYTQSPNAPIPPMGYIPTCGNSLPLNANSTPPNDEASRGWLVS